MSTVSPDSVAQDQIRSFVERIMRLREEVKAINGDIREVYAEAKGNGFDKTVLGKVVNYIEKRATSAGELAEGEALFDLYLAAFDGATPVATHTHEAAGYDRLTGEVRDDIAGNGAGGAGNQVQVATVRASSSAQPLQQDSAEVARGAHNPQVAGSIPAPATKSEPASLPSEIAEPGDRGAVVPSAAPVVAEPNDYSKPNPWCLDQEECGLNSWDHFCLRCQRVKAERQAVEAVQ